MLRLRTLGGLSLASGDGPLTGAATQRRRLALLALLAVAGERGMARDKVVAYLWPESDAERARHVLNQLVYAQRKELGGPSLFAGRKSLRLDPAAIWTDVGAFEGALARHAMEEAVDVYGGAFLDGFFLKDAAEFERWADSWRQRLARRYGDALRELARAATDRGETSAAIGWWRRAAEHDPLDSEVATALVQALASAGLRPDALRAAREHETALRRELGVEPGAHFRDTLARIVNA
jgi:DNA-binding SARP family transcriptional activator